jgi:hypothetical protein
MFGAAEVSLAPFSEALDLLGGASAHRVVLLCPYLAADERAALIAACDARQPSPAVVEVTDSLLPPGAHVRVRRTSTLDLGPMLATLGLPVGMSR